MGYLDKLALPEFAQLARGMARDMVAALGPGATRRDAGGAATPRTDAKPNIPGGQTVAHRRKMAMRPPSFTDMLPYGPFDPDEKIFVMKDGATLGVMFELGAVATEAQAHDYLVDRANKVQEALQAIPESDASPWIVQFFLNDDRNIEGLNQYLRDYIAQQHKNYPERAKEILGSPYTQAVLEEFRKHLQAVSGPEGLFTDTQVTGQPWRGQIRRVRCCIYKRFAKVSDDPAPAAAQMEATATTIEATLMEAGVSARRCNGRDLYDWLVPFFNPKLPWAKDAGELLRMAPYPGDVPPPGVRESVGQTSAPLLDWDLASSLNFSQPYSDLDAGVFEFGGVPIKALTLQSLRTQPTIGHFSAEQTSGKESFARFDRLPAGSMLSISITIAPQYKLERHIEKIRDASRAATAVARETFIECEMVLARMLNASDKLYPMMLTLYITGKNLEEVDAAISQANALLIPTGLRFIAPQQDLVPLDTFMRALPFNFDPAFDTRSLRRSRLTFASQIAALLPVYGRARGTEHPSFWFWNRGGEPIWQDPLNKRDRKKNAHLLVLGPTGAGKSATLNYLAMQIMAIHRPRLVIADAGRSFALLLDYFKTLGLSTHSVTLTSTADVSLPPFLYGTRLLQDPDVMSSFHAAEEQARGSGGLAGAIDDAKVEALLSKATPMLAPDIDTAAMPASVKDGGKGGTGDNGDDDDDTEKRDLLGEMLIAAVMMITGGEASEIARMSRADRYLITIAIVRASMLAKKEGRPHPLTQDVAIELMGMGRGENMNQSRQIRAEEMGQSMMTFTQGLRGKLFNRVGADWPDVDVTLVEMGTLTKDGYSDALAVAYTGLIDSVQSRGERAQDEDRPMIFLTDEGHLITTNELLGPKIAKGTKMWRKLNIWFWLATQNLKDFPDSMDKVLSMCEYWMLLTMDKSEIEQVSRFRSLTPEQRFLMESARKEPPKYTEGVIINASGQFLFRNVPPALPIALAMTEGHEKAHRRRLMDLHGCTEMEAAHMVAEELALSRS